MKPALLSLLILASAAAEPSKGVLTNLVEGIASAGGLEYAQPGSRAGGAAPTKVKIVLGGLARTGMTSVQQALTQLLNTYDCSAELRDAEQRDLSLLDGACGMLVVGEELFVGDTGNDRLQVFSLAGEHRRSITGEWDRPEDLCFVKDRLYLVEMADYEEDEEGPFPPAGRRIFVLSLQGDTLQVYTHPVEGQLLAGLCCFDGKLLAPVRRIKPYSNGSGVAGTRVTVDKVVVLCGV